MQSISEVAQDESDKHTLQDAAGHRVFWILVALAFAENYILDLDMPSHQDNTNTVLNSHLNVSWYIDDIMHIQSMAYHHWTKGRCLRDT